MSKILVLGSCGQIGTELVLALREKFGNQTVIAADLKEACPTILNNGPYIQLDALDKEGVRSYIIGENIKEVYLLAALLSATAEKNPEFAWRLNMEGLFTILDLAKEGQLQKIFWPSSIAVFGPTTPANQTPQHLKGYTVRRSVGLQDVSRVPISRKGASQRFLAVYSKHRAACAAPLPLCNFSGAARAAG